MKRLLSVLLSLLIAMSMFAGTDFAVYAYDTAVANTVDSTIFPYTNADVYVADSIIKGMIDKEGNINNKVISLDIALNKQYTYELIAKELVDDELLMFNSLYWQNIKKTLSADFVSMANWEEELCVLLIIDYLNYYGQTEEFESNYIKNSIKFTETIYEGVMNYVANEYDNAKGPVNQILATMSVEEAKELTEKWGFTKDIKKYIAVGNDLQTITTSATQYYKNLTKALSVQRADEARIDFLKRLKISGSGNTPFVNAIDKVIAMYESSYATLALGESTRIMLNHGMSVLFSEAKKACPEATAIIDGLKTYTKGLNWLFNSDDISENNLKLVLIYTIGNYAKSSVRSTRDAFTANPTVENAQTFISTYEGYLKYQEYASESTKGFVSSALFDGVFNQIKGWFTDKNVETYKDFIELLDSNINICYSLERLVQQDYDFYFAIVDYDCSAFADDDSSGSENIPVASVSFKQPEIILNSTDDICLIYADIYPANATNKKIKYTCSDESILSVPVNGGFATQKGTGVVTVTATTEDGGYTAIQTVYVGDYTTSEVTANGTCGDNAQYTLYNNGTLVISGSGKMNDYYYTYSIPWYNFRESIKKVVIYYGVTNIGKYAFSNCSSLTNITIPDSVTSIGSSAFDDCASLTNITIPDSCTSIGEHAFRHCSNLTSITIPDSVTSIGAFAFYNCTRLTSISIPDSVTSIGNYTFYDCTSLTSVIIGDGVSRIYSNTFEYCTSLTNVIIGNGVTSIDSDTFRNCTSLTNVIIGNGVTSIGSSAFRNCTSLTSVTIGNSVTSIGSCAFSDCTNLKSISIPNSVTNIGDYAFNKCIKLTSATIGNSVIKIGGHAFYNCANLTNVTIPDSVTNIGDYAFQYCKKLTSIKIGNSVTSIGKYAFCDCTSLTSISIPDSVKSIGDNTFYNCKSLTSISIPDSVTSIGGSAFYNCTSLASISISDSVTIIGSSAFLACTSLTSITIPDSVTSIGEYAFKDCTSLTNVIIGNGVTSIESSTFVGCTNLKSVTIGNGITSIDSDIFKNSTSLTNVIIGDGVTSIENYAFYGCTNLKSVTIPDSVTSIGICAFEYCTSLTSIIVEENNPIYDSRNNCNAIIKTSDNTLIIGCSTTVIPNTVTSIGEDAFYNCTSLTSITIPDSVISINYAAFHGCTSLTSITIPDSVTYIGGYAFQYCEKLTSVTIGNSVTNIDHYAFSGCWNLNQVYYFGDNFNDITIGYSNSCLLNANITSLKLGDTDRDNTIGINDVTLTQMYIADLETSNTENLLCADVNGDGEVNVKDVTLIQMYLADLIEKF